MSNNCYYTDVCLSVDAIDNELLKQTLVDVVSGKQVEIPIYDYKTHTR